MRFQSCRHAEQYLGNSVVVVDGVLYYITQFTDKGAFSLYEVGKRRKYHTLMHWKWPGLHKAWTPPIGMVNVPGVGAMYILRKAMRQWIVGLTRSNTLIKNHGKPLLYGRDNLFKTKAFADAVKGKYPTFEVAHSRLMRRKGVVSVAFSRQFALKRLEVDEQPRLIYKHNPEGVAKFNENMEPIWNPGFEYLQEQLDEVRDGKHLKYL